MRMSSMEEEATGQATRLYENAMMSTISSSTRLKDAMENQTSTQLRKGRSTLKRETELRLSQVGLLQLTRDALPTELGLQTPRNVNFYHSTFSMEDKPGVQRRAVNDVLSTLRSSARCGPTDRLDSLEMLTIAALQVLL